jgi:DNA polymerase delta subunit 2
VSLEDDSGRIKLIGSGLGSIMLVTGCIVAVMGTENVNGDFEVIDIKFPDLAPQPHRWALTKPPPAPTNAKKGKAAAKLIKDEDVEMGGDGEAPRNGGGKIAIVSGLEFSGTDTSYAMELDLLLEYLLGEALDPAAQAELSRVSRLIVAGNSIAADRKTAQESDSTDRRHTKKYGYDSSSYNAQPSQLFDDFLAELLPTVPVTLLPGQLDPANSSYPQQPIHTAMFPKSRSYGAVPGSEQPGWFHAATNPLEMEVEGWRVLGTGGQNVDDMAKYVDSEDRLGMMEAMCRWRCSAPTAPDTLCESSKFTPDSYCTTVLIPRYL